MTESQITIGGMRFSLRGCVVSPANVKKKEMRVFFIGFVDNKEKIFFMVSLVVTLVLVKMKT